VIVQNPEELLEESGWTMRVDEQSKRTNRLGKSPRRSPAYGIGEEERLGAFFSPI
jgi:hypothetical protein